MSRLELVKFLDRKVGDGTINPGVVRRTQEDQVGIGVTFLGSEDAVSARPIVLAGDDVRLFAQWESGG
jgi:hypothetical protein